MWSLFFTLLSLLALYLRRILTGMLTPIIFAMVCLRLDFNPLSLTYFSFLSLPHPMIDFYRAFEQELLPGPVTVLLNRKKSASISVSCVLAFLIFVKNIFSLFRGC